MKRKTVAQLREKEDFLVAQLLRTAGQLEGVRASRRRAERREAKETVRARYVETRADSVPCTTCDVDTGADCLWRSSGSRVETGPPHASRVRDAIKAALPEPEPRPCSSCDIGGAEPGSNTCKSCQRERAESQP